MVRHIPHENTAACNVHLWEWIAPPFWDIKLRSPVRVKRRFGGPCRLRLQRQLCLIPASNRFLFWLVLRRLRWKQNAPKRRLAFKGLQYIISHERQIIIAIALRTPNSTPTHLTSVKVSNLWLLWCFVSWGAVRMSKPDTPEQPWVIDESRATGKMRIYRGNGAIRRKPDPVSLCTRQVPYDMGTNPDRCGGKPVTNGPGYYDYYSHLNKTTTTKKQANKCKWKVK